MILVTQAIWGRVVCRLAYAATRWLRCPGRASRGLPSGIALHVADYEDASALKRALAAIDYRVRMTGDGDASTVMRYHATP